jgi:hypothetical protein
MHAGAEIRHEEKRIVHGPSHFSSSVSQALWRPQSAAGVI